MRSRMAGRRIHMLRFTALCLWNTVSGFWQVFQTGSPQHLWAWSVTLSLRTFCCTYCTRHGARGSLAVIKALQCLRRSFSDSYAGSARTCHLMRDSISGPIPLQVGVRWSGIGTTNFLPTVLSKSTAQRWMNLGLLMAMQPSRFRISTTTERSLMMTPKSFWKTGLGHTRR